VMALPNINLLPGPNPINPGPDSNFTTTPNRIAYFHNPLVFRRNWVSLNRKKMDTSASVHETGVSREVRVRGHRRE